MKNVMPVTITSLIVLFLIAISFSAETSNAQADCARIVYLDASQGQDTNAGASASNAFKTLDRAIGAIGAEGGKIVLVSDYSITSDYTEPQHSAVIAITSDDGSQDYGGALAFAGSSEIAYRLSGPTTFSNLIIKTATWTIFAAQFNPIVFGEGIETVNTHTPGVRQIFVVGGYQTPNGTNNVLDLDSSITIDSGTFYKISGFTRTKGIATHTYTGTSHITVNGGDIVEVYGASLYNHYSGSTMIRVTGGTIGAIFAGGDVSRYLRGSAVLELLGGTINRINVNNVVGNATLTLDGSAFGQAFVSYYSDTIKNLAIKEGSEKVVTYNSLYYSPSQIAALEQSFDKVENVARVFVREGAGGDGCTEISPCASLKKAFEYLAVSGGTVHVSGSVGWDLDATVPIANGNITIQGEEVGNLVFPRDAYVKFESDIMFEHIEISHEGTLKLNAFGSNLVFGEGVATDSASGITVFGGADQSSITIHSGSFEHVSGIAGINADFSGIAVIVVNGGHIEHLWSGTMDSYDVAHAQTSVYGGRIGALHSSAGRLTDSLTVRLYGGNVDTVKLDRLDRNVTLKLSGAQVAGLSASEWGQGTAQRTLIYDTDAYAATVAGIANLFDNKITSKYVYIRDGGEGDGSHPGSPLGDLNEAITFLGEDGYVVISGSYTVDKAYLINPHPYKVTLTSYDHDQDYRRGGAVVTLAGNLLLGGETVIEKLQFNSPAAAIIFAMGKPLTIGDDVDTALTLGSTTYINIVGGHNGSVATPHIRIVINSGNWGVLRGGTNHIPSVTTGVTTNITINGGTFHRYVGLSHRGTASGTINLTVNGGVFKQGLFAIYEEDGAAYSATYDVVFNINGGEFWSMVGPARSQSTILSGTYHVNLNGGDFSHLTDFRGTEQYGGSMTSSITISPDFAIEKEPVGTLAFTNFIRVSADPYLFYYNGFYYYTATGGSSIALHKVANIPDLKTSAGYTILKPTYGQNLWSPEIHYFSAADVGETNAGWYMFIAFDDGTTANQRQYVVKCLDGDNLLGRWGNPVTGEVNVPIRMVNADHPSFNQDVLVGGTSVIRIDGQAYLSYISEEGRGTADFHQTVNISRFINPWTLVGEPSIITVPEYDWEMGGYGQSSTEPELWYPKVVEGATAVYGENGEVYIAYSASGYWTIYYSIGFLKFMGGDPFDATNWVKHPTPILSRSSTVNGIGTGPTFTDEEGKRWIIYQARLGADASGGRVSIVEPYYTDHHQLTIGNGSGHPAPLETEYTVIVNRTPLSEKMSGFGSAAPVMTSISLDGMGSLAQAGTVKQSVVMATYSNNTTIDVTAWAQYASSDPRVADISATGLVMYKNAGSTVLTATYGGLVTNAVTVQVYGTATSAAKPGKPVLADNNGHDNGIPDGAYDITMNLWYGENCWIYTLYENDVPVDTKALTYRTPAAQTAVTAISGKPNGTYRYRAELTNAFGTTSSDTHVVTVTRAAPDKPVLAHDNWDGDSSFQVHMNLWWGTNGATYRLYENGVLIDTQTLMDRTPSPQSAVTNIANKGSGTYEYRAELVNYAGVASSDKLTVVVDK